MVNDNIYTLLKKEEVKYLEKDVRKCVSILKGCKSGSLSERHKNLLLFMCSKIITRNVDSFFSSIRSIDELHIVHEVDDIVSECFLVLDKCVDRFDLKNKEYKFYFYLNSAIQKRLWRIKNEEYCSESSKHIHIDVEDIIECCQDLCNFTQHPLLLKGNFSTKEMLLMQSKINDEGVDDFCKRIEIKKVEYYNIMKSLKSKITRKYLES